MAVFLRWPDSSILRLNKFAMQTTIILDQIERWHCSNLDPEGQHDLSCQKAEKIFCVNQCHETFIPKDRPTGIDKQFPQRQLADKFDSYVQQLTVDRR